MASWTSMRENVDWKAFRVVEEDGTIGSQAKCDEKTYSSWNGRKRWMDDAISWSRRRDSLTLIARYTRYSPCIMLGLSSCAPGLDLLVWIELHLRMVL